MQSFFVGWTNIMGWLVVVTVQSYFAGIFHTSPLLIYKILS